MLTMNLRRHAFRCAMVALPVACCALVLAQSPQGLDPATMLKPPADSWPTYHGDYTGRRHSRLTQITPENVHQLTVAWTFQGAGGGIKAAPVLLNGAIYLTMPRNIWAIDARSGRPIWRYSYPPNQGLHIRHRGPAVSRGTPCQ